jgi:site-specific DNA-methyltransferase (adenine-specific)
MEVFDLLPEKCVDLLIADPPYNRRKTFHTITFHASEEERYRNWLEGWVSKLPRILRPAATVYVCCDWQCSQTVYTVLSRYFRMRNRITWEREKGRGAHSNWKNAHEDIWFATMSDKYTFNLDAVKVKRKVLAPYRVEGQPKDWSEETSGNYRTTHPSNLWTDVTVPFWSMQENTDHPTQKPEKLIAKLILASSNEGDVVFDPFSGSGTTSVTAKKLNRCFFSVERDGMYCLLAEKRLELAGRNPAIQGYEDGVFWERNTTPHRKKEE